jgi:DNA-directed RNA polymerase subunit RPC12/RpoP
MTSNNNTLDYRGAGQRVKCSRCKGKIHELLVTPPASVMIVCHKCGAKVLEMSQKAPATPQLITDIAKQVGPGGD